MTTDSHNAIMAIVTPMGFTQPPESACKMIVVSDHTMYNQSSVGMTPALVLPVDIIPRDT